MWKGVLSPVVETQFGSLKFELTSPLQIEEYCEKYCAENFSMTETSMSEFMMYISAAFILVLVIGLNYLLTLDSVIP